MVLNLPILYFNKECNVHVLNKNLIYVDKWI